MAEEVVEGYPEHEKLKKINDKSQTIGEFIDWINYEKDIVLAKYEDYCLFPIRTPIEKLLAEFFEIDSDKLESEKCQMLELIRKRNLEKPKPTSQ